MDLVARKLLINATGVGSAGGLVVLEDILATIQDSNDCTVSVLVDSLVQKKIAVHWGIPEPRIFQTELPRWVHPLLHRLNRYRSLATQFDFVLHLGNFAPRFKVKNVVFMQNLLPFEYRSVSHIPGAYTIKDRILNRLIRRSLKAADLVVVQSGHVRKVLQSYTDRDIVVIKPHLPVARFTGGKPGTGIMTITNSIPYKQAAFACEVLNRVKRLKPDLRITVVGVDMSTRFPGITFFKHLARPDMLGLLGQHQALFHASAVETLGLPIVEAQKMGLDVMVPDLDYAHSICDGPTVFFDPKSAEDATDKMLKYIAGDLIPTDEKPDSLDETISGDWSSVFSEWSGRSALFVENQASAGSQIPVLYVHPCGVFGGASRSLLEMINAFPKGRIRPYVITPRGNAEDYFREIGGMVMSVRGISQFDNTRYGHYRGMRWLVLLRELYYLLPTMYALWRASKEWPKFKIIHLNEITMPVPLFLAARLYPNAKIVVHVRSVQETRSNLRRNLLNWLFKKYAYRLVPIDSTVAKSLARDLDVEIVLNGSTLANDRESEALEPVDRLPANFHERPLRVASVGNLLPMKGILEFLHCAKICRERGLNVEFNVVGDFPRKHRPAINFLLEKLALSYDLNRYCEDFVQRHKLENRIAFSGFMSDVREVYRNTDIICFPSHLNAVGRPVIEAAFFSVPSIVAMDHDAVDVMQHRKTGLRIRPVENELADAIEYFYRNPDEITRMGKTSYELAHRNFDIHRNANKVLDLYRTMLVG